MEQITPKTQSFQDLRVWQSSHELVLAIYKLSRNFPKDENFGLTSQIRRAAVSITSNIAEGYGRRQSKDKEHFYVMAKGSLEEVKNQLLIARDLEYISVGERETISELSLISTKQLNALIKTHSTS
jgi:four helix bundle protein